MTLITCARFELPIGFDARVLIGLCCDDIVWEDERVLSGSFRDDVTDVRLTGTLGEQHCSGSFSREDGAPPNEMIEIVQRRLQRLCEHRLCRNGEHEVLYNLAV